MNKNYQQMMEEIINKIDFKKKRPKLLLHACCAPCSSYVLEYLSKYFDITIYYYNPNIYPYKEFEKRTIELNRLVNTMETEGKVDVVVENYDYNDFKEAVKGHELDEEGGERCFICYNLRMEKAAIYAKNNGYDYFTTTLSISPYKNALKLNEIGEALEEKYNIKYLYADFKKKNGYKRSIELSKKYNLYRQNYCGCTYSKRKPRPRKIKHLALKIFLVLFLIAAVIGYIYINKDIVDFNKYDIKSDNLVDIDKSKISIKNNAATVNEYYFYGTHFNINGTVKSEFTNIDNMNLVFIGKKFQYSYKLNFDIVDNNINYYASKTLNEGFNLDDINIDTYECLVEVNGDSKTKYYDLINKTEYSKTTYTTITSNNFNKKLVFSNKSDKLVLKVSHTNEETYDVIIDPGHGGHDEGACYNNVCETAYTLDLANLLKDNLVKKGYKVKLTRYDDSYLSQYGDDGRVARTYKSKAKLLISIHLNSTTVMFDGYELYISNNMNQTFANNIITSLNSLGKLKPSNNTSFSVGLGLYSRNLSSSDVATINKNKDVPYSNVSTNTNYYFMIRETGGYMSGAYVDGGSNGGENKYRNSNVGLESYILELGYINNPSNVEMVKNNKDKYMSLLSDEIDKYLKNN